MGTEGTPPLSRASAWLLALALAGHGIASIAQPAPRSSAAGAWMCPCPGRHVPLGSAPNCNTACFGGGNVGARPGPQQQLLEQFGGQLGSLLRESAAQQQAERAAAQRAQEVELQRLAEEEARRKEVMKQRLLSMMMGVGPRPALAPMLEARPMLQPMLGDTPPVAVATLADIPDSSAMAQLTRAAYYSDQAIMTSDEDAAAALADAAFNAALGAPIDIAVPPTTAALRLPDGEMPRVEAARAAYRAATSRLEEAVSGIMGARQQRELAERAAETAAARLQQVQGAEAAATPTRQVARAEELASARRTSEEAKALVQALDRRITSLHGEVDAAQADVQSSASAALNLLSVLRQRHGIAPAPAHQPEKDAYLRGIQDASQCRPQNGSHYCSGLRTEAGVRCTANYDNGYRVGERIKENNLRDAHLAGEQARQSGGTLLGFWHPKAVGPCRVRWLEAFNSGYGGAPFSNLGR